MEHNYMHIKFQRRGPGPCRNLEVMVNIQMVSIDMIKIVKNYFISLRHVYYLIHLKMLTHDCISNTEQDS